MPTPAAALFTRTAAGPFDLAASARFLEGVLPIADRDSGVAHGPDGVVVALAFVPDGEAHAVGVEVRSAPNGIEATVTSDALDLRDEQLDRVAGQVARIFSLDVDGTGFAAVGDRDPVIGGLQRRYDGLRPVNFLSPYEAAAWFLIGHRIRMAQAAAIKQRLAAMLGEAVEIAGTTHHAFPAPAVLASMPDDPAITRGLTDKKVGYLRALGRAAADSDLLDGAALRARPVADAIEALRALPGVGPFTADGIVLRGAGAPDVLTLHEPRLARAIELAYDLDATPGAEQITTISEAWRPYRTWATVLLRVALEDA